MIYDKYLDSEHPDSPRQVYTKICLGFRFTDSDERCIRQACRRAMKYMKTYGQGQTPATIDLRHYENSYPVPGFFSEA